MEYELENHTLEESQLEDLPQNEIEKPKRKRRPSSKPLSEKQLEALRKGRESRRKTKDTTPIVHENVGVIDFTPAVTEDASEVILDRLNQLESTLKEQYNKLSPVPTPTPEPPLLPKTPKRPRKPRAKKEAQPCPPPQQETEPPQPPPYVVRFV